MDELKSPVVTIGIPTYNSEKYLKKTIDSVLNQTFRNFTLIISDNVSTDSTSKICMEYVQKDHRVKYVKQKKNLFMMGNFRFLADSAKTKYFVWLESDDCWEPTFLKKNIGILESNPNLVGSISEIDFYGKYAYRYKVNGKFEKHFIVKPYSGDYHKKIETLLKSQGSMIFGVYRTKEFQRSLPRNQNWLYEYELLLPLLKHGDFHVIDEILMRRSADGMSSSSFYHTMRYSFGLSRSEIIFMNWPLIQQSLKNLGLKFMLKNFHLFFRFTYRSYGRTILGLIRFYLKKVQ